MIIQVNLFSSENVFYFLGVNAFSFPEVNVFSVVIVLSSTSSTTQLCLCGAHALALTPHQVHMPSVFDHKQTKCWTIDKAEPVSGNWLLANWIIDFKNGMILKTEFDIGGGPSYGYRGETIFYVKAVRSAK